ncbi:rhamnogalacturonan acetylesterase [Pedobacter xixiisoli]|uniref:Lysophospholipase L1 n=1 Tax=Pedobacter xixiisoli TaxID=1476464 RepID=A0A285ZXS9_9SPHI|nr:rhamnogalacturonan acetylesterase [Pedobacter xixiisoli]SOD14427.1 Lysophospholipase L1 [Pedobacter xixiisoli]
MKKKLLISVPLLLLLLSFTLRKDKTTLFIIGDSTAANKAEKAYPETGWGMEIASFFNDDLIVDNRAANGRSTKSFLNEKRWDGVLKNLKAGDFVFIQFGHNDEKIDKPEVGTSLEEYKSNLVLYINQTREKKANPILLTPIMRRSFKDGVFTDSHKGYPAVVRRVADSLKVPLIDMHKKTEKLLVGLGEQSSIKLFNHLDSGHVNYPKGVKDNTHLSIEGAKEVATLVVEGIKETKIGLVKYLKK